MSESNKWIVFLLGACIVTAWSAMFYYLGVRLTEGWLQTGAVERGYAEWVLPKRPHLQSSDWRWIEPEGDE